ncbi:MAG TPA: HD domain-containing phosphohydrolase [Pseudogracilibacillus sp.]|nr:HD domain-containing phosphohydrolase [Pseudogracilibacillus sp.]
MNVEVDRLKPGMVLVEDVIGKSGEPIIKQGTTLTETHITFLKKFLIKDVSVTTDGMLVRKRQQQKPIEEDSSLTTLLKQASSEYEKMFNAWRNSVAIDMYAIRKTFIPFFTKVIDLPMQEVLFSYTLEERDNIFNRTIVQSILAIQLARLNCFEKKDWLQIGFATLLSDSGLSRLITRDFTIDSYKKHDKWQLHPLYSYQMVENITTLTKITKIAILQHHEYLDGTGFPGKISGDQISSYSRIVTISDFVLSLRTNNIATILTSLKENLGKKLDRNLTLLFMKRFSEGYS